MIKPGVFITGIDAGVGQTTATAWLLHQWAADYWQPIAFGPPLLQQRVLQNLTALPPDHFHPATYHLVDAVAPHESARGMGITLDMARFRRPITPRPLVVGGIGGLLTPLAGSTVMLDLCRALGLPMIVVAHTTHCTINQILLNIQATRAYGVGLLGVILNGRLNPGLVEAITQYGHTRVLAEIAELPTGVNMQNLHRIAPRVAFAEWEEDRTVQAA